MTRIRCGTDVIDDGTDCKRNHFQLTAHIVAWKLNHVVCDVNAHQAFRRTMWIRIVNGSVHYQNQLIPHLRNAPAKTLVVMPVIDHGLQGAMVCKVVDKR